MQAVYIILSDIRVHYINYNKSSIRATVMDPRRQRLTHLQQMWSQHIFQKKCMYNRFSVEDEEEDEGVTRRKRE